MSHDQAQSPGLRPNVIDSRLNELQDAYHDRRAPVTEAFDANFDLPRLTTPGRRRSPFGQSVRRVSAKPSSSSSAPSTRNTQAPVEPPGQLDEAPAQRDVAEDEKSDDFWRWSDGGIVDVSVESQEPVTSAAPVAARREGESNSSSGNRHVYLYRWMCKTLLALCLWLLVAMVSYYFLVAMPRLNADRVDGTQPQPPQLVWPAVSLVNVQPFFDWQSWLSTSDSGGSAHDDGVTRQ